MNEAAIRDRLIELSKVLRSRAARNAQGSPNEMGIYDPAPPDEKISAEDLLDTLRMQINYVAFDLEATRRENRYLRQMLDTRPHSQPDADSPDPPTI